MSFDSAKCSFCLLILLICLHVPEAFSKIKTVLRSIGARTREELQEALIYAITTITENDASGWFCHCGYKVPDSSNEEAV